MFGGAVSEKGEFCFTLPLYNKNFDINNHQKSGKYPSFPFPKVSSSPQTQIQIPICSTREKKSHQTPHAQHRSLKHQNRTGTSNPHPPNYFGEPRAQPHTEYAPKAPAHDWGVSSPSAWAAIGGLFAKASASGLAETGSGLLRNFWDWFGCWCLIGQ